MVMYTSLLLLLSAALLEAAVSSTLRIQWIGRRLQSDLAKYISDRQSQCTKKVYYHEIGNNGMGSDIHVWTQALCNSMQNRATLLQVEQDWIWNDQESCDRWNSTQPLDCYFNQRTYCPLSEFGDKQIIEWTNKYDRCPSYITDLQSRQEFRAAAVEYLFSTLRPDLVEEAERVARDLFGERGAPSDMISVHVRWGDKRKEMDLVHPRDYVNAIQAMVDKHGIVDPHVFITTESHAALVKIEKEVAKKRKPWKLHYYPGAVFHHDAETSMVTIANQSAGKLGRASLISLLLAMEGRHYVLTSGSNWSRLIDELRRNVVDADCGGCSDYVDLRRAVEKVQDW